ncbi:MAG: rod shape-determining protein RodA [Cytophagaceae bacterium]|jgi:rod shape determining protein RodA|nr:rod shape-determining protein RodA [Cytophagaceae bacterium]
MREESLSRNIDWVTVGLYALFVSAGWLNIFAVVYNPDPEVHQNIFDLSLNSGKQLLWITVAFFSIISIFAIDYKIFSTLSYIFYFIFLLVLIATIVIGTEVNGSRSWIGIGDFRIQPAEFAKFATALALSNFLSNKQLKWNRGTIAIVGGMILCPMMLIILQKETGGALAFLAFVLVLYREGLSGWFLIVGVWFVGLFILTILLGVTTMIYVLLGITFLSIVILVLLNSSFKFRTALRGIMIRFGICLISIGFVFSVNFIIYHVLKPHQRNRVLVLFDSTLDLKGKGYQINQSKIAIGSGGFFGKGFLDGTQTKFDFVPEQSTDFIFCTIGEEHGWFGSVLLIGLYAYFLVRIVNIAERQKDKFARMYGYCVAAIIFFNFMVNIGMTIGLFPIIGIPLPFFSYGGSSMISFTIILFVFLKLDAHRKQILAH